MVVASELLEATRAIAGRLRHARPHDADRLIGARLHDRREGGHGRWPARARSACAELARRFSRRAVIADFAAIAAAGEGSPLNAVLLGAHRRPAGVLPIAAEAFRAAIRAEGKAVEANLRGFEAGLRWPRGQTPVRVRADAGTLDLSGRRRGSDPVRNCRLSRRGARRPRRRHQSASPTTRTRA